MPASQSSHYDVIVLGAGAAGLMCAQTAGARGLRVLVLERANRPGKKILMSGGGRCNFTHLHNDPEHFICSNPHFVKSALSRYTPWDFLALVERHRIPWHEKQPGQLFCDRTARDIVDMLLAECEQAGVSLQTRCQVEAVEPGPPHLLQTSNGPLRCSHLVVATGGYSIPTLGGSGFGYDFARQLGLQVLPTRAALVPFTLGPRKLAQFEGLSGVAVDCTAAAAETSFRDQLLFTHRGLSGPAILQISSYWQPGTAVQIDLFPDRDLAAELRALRSERPRQSLSNALAATLPRRVAQRWCDLWLGHHRLGDLSDVQLQEIGERCQQWQLWPDGTEGYRTAEVTLGGVDTDEISSRSFASHRQPGVYFIGEVLDVTGHLGGHNFQWAWASGHACGMAVD